MSVLPVASPLSAEMALIIRESAEEYHAKAKEYLSSHHLSDFRKCPALYRKKKLGLIEDEDRPAYPHPERTPR